MSHFSTGLGADGCMLAELVECSCADDAGVYATIQHRHTVAGLVLLDRPNNLSRGDKRYSHSTNATKMMHYTQLKAGEQKQEWREWQTVRRSRSCFSRRRSSDTATSQNIKLRASKPTDLLVFGISMCVASVAIVDPCCLHQPRFVSPALHWCDQ